MYWDGMRSFVDDASLGDVSGTVTVTQNTSFGLAQEGTAGCEMRVSWTPLASMDGGLARAARCSAGRDSCSPPANARRSRQLTDEPRLQTQPRGGVPDVTDTLEGFREVCDRLAGAAGPLAADAERASGFRYGHEDWLVQFKREGAGIVLLDPVALTRAGADWGMFNDAVGDAVWILHDSLQDLPGFADIGLTPQTCSTPRSPRGCWGCTGSVSPRSPSIIWRHARQGAFRR